MKIQLKMIDPTDSDKMIDHTFDLNDKHKSHIHKIMDMADSGLIVLPVDIIITNKNCKINLDGILSLRTNPNQITSLMSSSSMAKRIGYINVRPVKEIPMVVNMEEGKDNVPEWKIKYIDAGCIHGDVIVKSDNKFTAIVSVSAPNRDIKSCKRVKKSKGFWKGWFTHDK